jgi:hypothetical protein
MRGEQRVADERDDAWQPSLDFRSVSRSVVHVRFENLGDVSP